MKNNMTFQEMLLNCNPDNAIRAALSLDSDSVNPALQAKGYDKVFYELLTLKPKKSKMILLVEEVEDWYDKKKYPHIHGKKRNNKGGLTWSLLGTPWNEFLGMEISTQYTVDQTVGYVIWEMTWTGFSQKERVGWIKKILKTKMSGFNKIVKRLLK